MRTATRSSTSTRTARAIWWSPTASSYIGTPTPTRELSLASTFTLFRDFHLFILFDHKGGHHLFN